MSSDTAVASLPLPGNWPEFVNRVLVYVCSLLKVALDTELGRRMDSAIYPAREQAEIDRLTQELQTEREVNRLLTSRYARMRPSKRAHYRKPERLRILELRALNGWTAARTAEIFLVDEGTVLRWAKELRELGRDRYLEAAPPVNKFPAFVDRVVEKIAVAMPDPTKRKIASALSRLGLHISASAVADRLKNPTEPIEPESGEDVATEEASEPCEQKEPSRTVAAHYENHVWNVDFTQIPTGGGTWTPWLPFSLPRVWPFCWHVAIALDMFSRKVMGFAVFRKEPTTQETQRFLERVMETAGVKPKYLVIDQGSQFTANEFRGEDGKGGWCLKHGIVPRFGAFGKFGSIAIIERFNRTLKRELLRRVLIPFGLDAMCEELRVAIEWHNAHRGHASLNNRTPDEVYFDRAPANERPRWEVRAKWPRESGCAQPYVPVRGECGVKLELDVAFYEGRKHLPVFTLRKVA